MGGASCPACGRPIAVKRAPRCLYCGAALAPDAAEEPAGAAAGPDPEAERLRTAFLLLARCRTEGDLAPALPWLAPALAAELQQQIDENGRAGVRHVIERITVGGVVRRELSGGGSEATIDALYAEYWQDKGSHMILRGLRGPKPHRETWRLGPARGPAGAKAGPDHAGGRCRGCGADLGARIETRCPYCGLVPEIDRLGRELRGIERADPLALVAEWQHHLDDRLIRHKLALGEAPLEHDAVYRFLSTLKSLLE